MRRPFSYWLFFCLMTLAGCTLRTASNPGSGREQQITVYTALDTNEVEAFLPDFTLAYPEIEVTLVRAAAGGLTQRILAERTDPQADLIWGMPLTNLIFLEWNELLKPYSPLGLERVDDHFRDGRQPPYWVGNQVMLSAFCVNTRLLRRKGLAIPSSWMELIEPEYRHQLVMSAPTSSDTGLLAVLSILRLYDELDGWRYLDRLHNNIAHYTVSDEQPCQSVSQGEVAIGIAKNSEGLSGVEFIYPSEGVGWELNASALVHKRTIQPAARTFLDWAISDSAMRLYARKAAVTAVKTGVAIPAGFPADPTELLFAPRKKDVPWTAANRDRILNEWQQRYGSKVKK